MHCPGLILLAMCLTSAAAAVAANIEQERPPADALYKDPSAPIDDRVRDLVARMTIQEVSVPPLPGTHLSQILRCCAHSYPNLFLLLPSHPVPSLAHR